MIVCIDAGNSRIKWGVHNGQAWNAQGAVAHDDMAQLAELAVRWPAPRRVMLANVAGPAIGAALRATLAAWQVPWCEVRAEGRRAGITNQYANPAQLGVDRWCALIGARHLGGSPRLVVMAGTATTIDGLDGAGNFLGGLILPGLDLMRRSLARDTAALPFADGAHAEWPRCTDDAIVSGCIEAQIGAIERAFGRLGGADACCVMSGGNAVVLASQLAVPHVLAHNLPLEGLQLLAREPWAEP